MHSSSSLPAERSSSNDDDDVVAREESSQAADDKNPDCWVDLTNSAKEWSRLLYPNPVCLLCTRYAAAAGAARDNVMVLSWLTAVDNAGRFMFSICERRWTAQVLQQPATTTVLPMVQFVLSVPVAGMEDMIKDIGSVSGRHCNKFEHMPSASGGSLCTSPPMSKRQRRKQLHKEGNIAGLRQLSFGSLFGIAGCVADLHCHVVQITENVVADHLLVVAQVENARVRKKYWDATKLLFRPASPETPPFLSFLGSQTFGYVLTNDKMRVDPCDLTQTRSSPEKLQP